MHTANNVISRSFFISVYAFFKLNLMIKNEFNEFFKYMSQNKVEKLFAILIKIHE